MHITWWWCACVLLIKFILRANREHRWGQCIGHVDGTGTLRNTICSICCQYLCIAHWITVSIHDMLVSFANLWYRSMIYYVLNCSLIRDIGHRYASNRSPIYGICHQYPCIAYWIAVSTTDMIVSLTNSLYGSLICLHRLPNCCIVHR